MSDRDAGVCAPGAADFGVVGSVAVESRRMDVSVRVWRGIRDPSCWCSSATMLDAGAAAAVGVAWGI